MKIALFGSKDFDSLEYHLNDSLNFLKHDVTHIDIKDLVPIPYKYSYWASKLLKKYDSYLFEKVATKIIATAPELVICTYRFTHPDCIKLIRKGLPNVAIIHVNPDQMTTLEYQQIFVSDYDAYFTKDLFMVDFMKNKMGLNTFYLPEAFNPRVHKKVTTDRTLLEKEVNIDVVAFGTMYPYRARMVENLINEGIDIKLYGTPDKRFPRKQITDNFTNEFITGDRKAEILSGAKIVFNNFHFAEVQSANVKFFEIGGIGAFQICDYKAVLEEYSIIDVEKFTFKNIHEAADLIKFYLDKPLLRHELAETQRIHFMNNHTYEHRISELLSKI
ncbi:glycosyltransferase [Flavobacterium qiangtangense]|uniref:Glycosyltransferase n=1 Tax=Flavobacterium qiangtangense TaxID=1442595 RepID=A0ABW1PQY3_9FLAO